MPSSAALAPLPPFDARVVPPGSGISLADQVRDFAAFGAPTVGVVEDGIPYLINEFWTAGQRQAHSLHEISYRACFKAQLPAFFISRLTVPGEAVHDPFMGRGTTPVQAALLGRRPVGNDINPLSRLLTRPRLAPPGIAAIEARLDDVPWHKGEIEREDLLAFYHPVTLRRLGALRRWLLVEAPLEEALPEPVADWIRMVSLNRLTGHSPGFFSGRTMPPNQAVSVEAQLRINVKLGVTPPVRDIARVILKKSRSLLRDGMPAMHPGALLSVGMASDTPRIASGSISLVVTSPPFLDIVQYAQDNWLRCWFAGIDVGAVEIAMHRTEAAWMAMVRAVLAEQARILRPDGHVAFEVGEVRKGRVFLERTRLAGGGGVAV